MSVLLTRFVGFWVKFIIESQHIIMMSISDCHKNRSREGHIYAFNVKNVVLNSVCCVMEYTIFSRVTWVLFEMAVLVLQLQLSPFYQFMFVDIYGAVLGWCGKDTPKPSESFFLVVYVFVDHKSHVHYPEIESVRGLGWTELLSTEAFLRHRGSCIIICFIRPCLTSFCSLKFEFSGFYCGVAVA